MTTYEPTPEEKRLREKLESILQRLHAFPDGKENELDLLARLAEAGHELHVSLTASGHEPKHHAYMIKNRGVLPEHESFYRHPHAAQDLIKFMDDPCANDDPVDTTVGDAFRFSIYVRRWQRYDTYRVIRTDSGWHISYLGIGGDCDRSGWPYLYQNLEQDNVDYPKDLPGYIAYLWDQANKRGASAEQIQGGWDKLAEWVTVCEENAPATGVLKGYKE